jgi:hypothetical protein
LFKTHRIFIASYCLSILFLNCSKSKTANTAPSPPPPVVVIDSSISSPKGLNIKTGYRLDTLTWQNNSEANLEGYKIYRDVNPAPNKLIATLSKGASSFIDTALISGQKYYYAITAYNTYTKESSKSSEVSTILEAAKLGQIGGLHYTYWTFGKATFNKLEHTVSFLSLPTNWDGTVNGDGLYFQMYQGWLNDTIGFYYGFQTRLQSLITGQVKKGFIFSRWSTRDTANYRVAPGGWGESAGYEGNFLGVRKWYEWGKGSYTVTLNKDSTGTKGDWYSVWVTNNQTYAKDYMGSLRFEKSTKSSGIKDNGITWTEIYSKDPLKKDTPLPNWLLSIEKVNADGSNPAKATSDYSDKMPTNIYAKNSIVYFDMGFNAMRLNNKGVLW